jgi:hypothetical protein
MQQADTFINAGWDFTTPIWILCNVGEYPKLWWQGCNKPPVANAGEDFVVYAMDDAIGEVALDGSGSTDEDGDPLTYTWYMDGEQIAMGVKPTVELSIGVHTIELIVNDGTENSLPDEVVITVVKPIVAKLQMVPRTLNDESHGKYVTAIVTLPRGTRAADIDRNEAWRLLPGDVEGVCRLILPGGKHNEDRVFVLFDRDMVIDALKNENWIGQHKRKGQFTDVEVIVYGKLKSGRVVHGHDTIKMILHDKRKAKFPPPIQNVVDRLILKTAKNK